MRRFTLRAPIAASLAGNFTMIGMTQSDPGAIPESIYAPMIVEKGTWDADVTFYEADKPVGRAHCMHTKAPNPSAEQTQDRSRRLRSGHVKRRASNS